MPTELNPNLQLEIEHVLFIFTRAEVRGVSGS
jgi:hypothetical protein